MTRMLRPVSWASCSRMWRVGFGVATNAAFSVSSCLALMVVRGPRRFWHALCSSPSLAFVSLSEHVELSVSFVSSVFVSGRSGDRLRSVHDDTARHSHNKTRTLLSSKTWHSRTRISHVETHVGILSNIIHCVIQVQKIYRPICTPRKGFLTAPFLLAVVSFVSLTRMLCLTSKCGYKKI